MKEAIIKPQVVQVVCPACKLPVNNPKTGRLQWAINDPLFQLSYGEVVIGCTNDRCTATFIIPQGVIR